MCGAFGAFRGWILFGVGRGGILGVAGADPAGNGDDAMSRPTRLVLGLVSLITVIGIAGGILVGLDASGPTVAWVSVGVGLVWLLIVISWALKAPPTASGGMGSRLNAGFGHSQWDGEGGKR